MSIWKNRNSSGGSGGGSVATSSAAGVVKSSDGLAVGGDGALTVKLGAGLKFDASKNVLADEPNINVLNLQNANLLSTGIPKGGFDSSATLSTFSNGVLGNWWVYGGSGSFNLGGQTFNIGDQLWVKTAFGGAPADLTTNFVKVADTVGQATTTVFGTVKLGSVAPLAPGGAAAIGTSLAMAREDHVHALPAVLVGATSGVAGTKGLVPAPAAGGEAAFLRGDGVWAAPETVPNALEKSKLLTSISASLTAPRAFETGELAFMHGVIVVANAAISSGAAFAWGTAGATWKPVLSSSYHTWRGVFNGAFSYDAGDVVTDATNSKRLFSVSVNWAPSANLDPVTGAGRSAWVPFNLVANQNFIGASASVDGQAGYVPGPGASEEGFFLRGDGVWAAPVDAFTGATASVAGTPGYVPAPSAGQQGRFLRGDATWAAESGATNGRAVLGSDLDLSVPASGVWTSTGLSIALPTAGTYIVEQSVRSTITAPSNTAYVLSRLYNVTAGAAVANSEVLGTYTGGSASAIKGTFAASVPITVTAATTIRLEANRNGTVTSAQVETSSSGRTALTWWKIA